MESLNILWKRRRMIAVGVVLTTAVAIFLVLLMPDKYLIQFVIEPGVAGTDEKGNITYLDTSANMAAKINGHAYDPWIYNQFELDPLEMQLKIDADVDRRFKTNALMVTSEWEEPDLPLGKEISSEIIRLIKKDYQKEVDYKKNICHEQIVLYQNEISRNETERKDLKHIIQLKENEATAMKKKVMSIQKIIDLQKHRREKVLSEASEVKQNTNKMISLRDKVIESNKKEGDISLLLYLTQLQENTEYANRIENQAYELNKDELQFIQDIDKLNSDIESVNIETLRLKLKMSEGLDSKIEDLKTQINLLKTKEAFIDNIKVVSEPELLPHRVGPKRTLIVVMAFLAGFFLFAFFAFLAECFPHDESREKLS